MRIRVFVVLALCWIALAQTASLAVLVQASLASGNAAFAKQALTQYRNARGTTPEYIEAFSWLGRADLAAKDYAGAEQNAAEVRDLCLDQLKRRKLDAEPSLPTALGASIEVQAQAAAAQGRRDQAVAFLRAEAKRWMATSLRPRIQKNLNLLTLEGKPAPPLEVAEGITDRKPRSLAQHRGHPLLLFFWAHWCSDCKNEIAVIAKLEQVYGPRGLTVIAPTQHYGYVAGGQEATRDLETRYIRAIYAQYYAGLGPIEVPLSEENFANYGVSTTPTLVLIDANGIVRLYNPGAMDYDHLAAHVRQALSPAPGPPVLKP
jgi:thiol-disulfide isomerase/thioredoxin